MLLEDGDGLRRAEPPVAKLAGEQGDDALAEGGAARVDDGDRALRVGLAQHFRADAGGVAGAGDARGHGDVDHVLPLAQVRLEEVHILLGGDLRGAHLQAAPDAPVEILRVEALGVEAGVLLPVINIGKGDHVQLIVRDLAVQ